jgi:ribosomal protein S12 methylthiotransferase accessory factor
VAVSLGKGPNLEAAFASALMEAAELHHAENCLGAETWAPALEIAGREQLDLEAFPRTERALEPETRIPWLRGVDLISGEVRHVPAETVCLNYRRQDLGGFFIATSNGLASGNHPAEAVSAALCEIVERDAVAIWDVGPLAARSGRAIDRASIADPGCRELLERFAQAGLSVQLWDVTSDIGIPVLLCEIRPHEKEPSSLGRRFRGAGCHVNPAVALSKALTEAAQARLTYIVGIRDDLGASAYTEGDAQRAGGLLLDALAARRGVQDFARREGLLSDDVTADVRWQLERLCDAGFQQVFAVDLTRPEYDLPVVRLAIPGLEGDCSDPEYRVGLRARLGSRMNA